MSVMPQLNKVCSVACTTVFSMGLILAPTTPAWTLEETSLGKSAELTAKSDAAVTDEAVGEKGKPAVELPQKPFKVASSGNIRLNTACVGITSTKEYFGLWKKLGSNKAKCKEGATGQPGAYITRLTCRIVTLNDGNFDNGLVAGPDHCIK